MSSNPSARLNGIFQDASASGGGNDALRYTAPREPSHKQQQQQQAAAAPAASAPASSVVFSTMVSLYQYDASARKYVQLGGATAGSKVAVGCVIVGAETSYNLLFYNAAKQHLCAVPVKFGTFKPTLQAKSYVNFTTNKELIGRLNSPATRRWPSSCAKCFWPRSTWRSGAARRP